MVLRLLHQGVGGVAMQPVSWPPSPAYHVTLLQDRGIPVVLCHRGIEGVRAPVIFCPHQEQGRLVGRALAQQGHRRVAVAFGYQLTEKGLYGIREAFGEAGGEVPEKLVYRGKTMSLDYAKEGEMFRAALEPMLHDKDPPTAIWATPDGFAQTIYFALERLGLRVPEDISLIGAGDVDRNGPFVGRLTSVVVDTAEMARRAVELLAEMESGRRPLHDDEVIPMPIALSDGETLGPPRADSSGKL